MRDDNSLEKNGNKSLQIRTKRRITSEDYCTSNNFGEDSLDNRPATNERAQTDTNTTTCTTGRHESERRSNRTIRRPLILEARTSKSNWYEPLKKSKVDLFQNFSQYSNNGSRSPHFYEEDSQAGITSSEISRRNDLKSIHGGKQNDSSKKTIVLPQGSKRKASNGNTLSAPTSKRLLCSAKKKLSERNQMKLDKPRTNLSSTAKSTRKSKKSKERSKSSTKRKHQSRASTAKRRKSKETDAKPRKSNRTSNSRRQSKQRRSTKNKSCPRNSRTKRTGVKSTKNEASGERIETRRRSRAKRLQSKKIEPLKVKLKETLKEKKTIKKTSRARKRRSVSVKDNLRSQNRKNTNTVGDAEVYPGKVPHTNPPPDAPKEVDKIDSLREQGDSSNTRKERIAIANADVEIQCCMLTSFQCLPNTRDETVKNESIKFNNFLNESSPSGEHLVRKQESKISNLDQKSLGETEQSVASMNGETGGSSQSDTLILNNDLSLLNSEGAYSVMEELAGNPSSSFSELGRHDEHLSGQNGEMSNLDRQSTSRNSNLVCNQSHPLTLARDVEMKSGIAYLMEELIKIPSNSSNDSRELNESLSNPPEENRTFSLKSFIQNETRDNLLNMDNHIDRNNQSHSLTLAQVLQFNPGINGEQTKIKGHPNKGFGESSERFLNPLEKSDKNLDEQMNVRNATKDHLMTIEEPVEDQQYNFQSFTIHNLPINPGVAIDMVEANETSNKLKKGRCNEFPTTELRNEISSDEPTVGNNKTVRSLLNTDDQTETRNKSHSSESFQSLSPTFSGGATQMLAKEIKDSTSSLNELKRLTKQKSDLPGDGSVYLNEQVDTNHKIEQCSTNVYDQAEESPYHFKASAQFSTLADVVAKVMKENIQPRSSLNGHVEQLPKSTENINKDSNQQVNYKLQETPRSESMALLPYEPPIFVSPQRENATSSFLSSESDGFNEQFSNSPEETTTINEVLISLLELVSLSLSQGARPEGITYSSDQIQEIESQIRSLRRIYIQESDSIPEDELGNETSSAEADNVPVNYIRTTTSLLLQGLPNWLRYLYNNLFRSKK